MKIEMSENIQKFKEIKEEVDLSSIRHENMKEKYGMMEKRNEEIKGEIEITTKLTVKKLFQMGIDEKVIMEFPRVKKDIVDEIKEELEREEEGKKIEENNNENEKQKPKEEFDEQKFWKNWHKKKKISERKNGVKTPKVRIISMHFNRLDLLQLQHESIMNFVMDKEVEYVVVNNARNSDEMSDDYKKIVFDNIHIKEDIKKYCDENNDTITYGEYSHKTYGAKAIKAAGKYTHKKYVVGFDGIVVILDADTLFYDRIHFGDFMFFNDAAIAGIPLGRGFILQAIIFHNQLLTEYPLEECDWFSAGFARGTKQWKDPGIKVGDFIVENPSTFEKAFFFKPTTTNYLRDRAIRLFAKRDGKRFGGSFYLTFYDEIKLIHYGRGGNWNKKGEKNIKRGKYWLQNYPDLFMRNGNLEEVFKAKIPENTFFFNITESMLEF